MNWWLTLLVVALAITLVGGVVHDLAVRGDLDNRPAHRRHNRVLRGLRLVNTGTPGMTSIDPKPRRHLIGWWVLLALGVVGLVIGVVVILTSPSQAWWSDTAPAWIEASATVLGFGAAAGAAILAARVYQLDRRRERAGQASLVAFWVEVSEEAGPEYRHQVFIQNGSQVPVYEVSITGHVPGMNPGIVVPMYGTPTGSPGGGEVKTLPPTLPGHPVLTVNGGAWAVRLQLQMNFRDAAGQRWERDHLGELTPITILR